MYVLAIAVQLTVFLRHNLKFIEKKTCNNSCVWYSRENVGFRLLWIFLDNKKEIKDSDVKIWLNLSVHSFLKNSECFLSWYLHTHMRIRIGEKSVFACGHFHFIPQNVWWVCSFLWLILQIHTLIRFAFACLCIAKSNSISNLESVSIATLALISN